MVNTKIQKEEIARMIMVSVIDEVVERIEERNRLKLEVEIIKNETKAEINSFLSYKQNIDDKRRTIIVNLINDQTIKDEEPVSL